MYVCVCVYIYIYICIYIISTLNGCVFSSSSPSSLWCRQFSSPLCILYSWLKERFAHNCLAQHYYNYCLFFAAAVLKKKFSNQFNLFLFYGLTEILFFPNFSPFKARKNISVILGVILPMELARCFWFCDGRLGPFFKNLAKTKDLLSLFFFFFFFFQM